MPFGTGTVKDRERSKGAREQAAPASRGRWPGAPAESKGTREQDIVNQKKSGAGAQSASPQAAAAEAAPQAVIPGDGAPPPLDAAPLAFENSAFLNSADGRPIRIIAEYLEPLARFRREQIQDTVVFFGSARFRGREEADHALELLENTGSVDPAPSHEQPAKAGEIAAGRASILQLKRAVAAVEMARYYEDARRLAQLLTQWAKTIPSRKHRFVVTSGGGPALWKRPTAARTRPAAKPSA